MNTTITDKQRVILEAAAQHPDGFALPPAHLPPAPRGAVAKALLKAGLVEPAGTAAEGDKDLAWKVDGAAVLLRISQAGLRAVAPTQDKETPTAVAEAELGGLTEAEYEAEQDLAQAALDAGIDFTAADAPQQVVAAVIVGAEAREQTQRAPLAAPDGPGGHDTAAAAAAAQDAPKSRDEAILHGGGERAADMADAAPAGAEAAPATEAPAAAPAAHTPPQGRAAGLRAAAAQLLALWDDAPGERAVLAEAIEALRAAMPQPRAAQAPRPPAGPRTPRQGTKQEAVLALLRRPEGASGPDIIAATGWAPHTVRGFLAGLKKRGIAVLVHERVRQVGPGKEGAKGSYTVYRVAAEPAG